MNKRIFLLICLAFIGLGGLFGGIAFIAKPDGSILHSSVSLLKHSPVSNYRLPGIFLLLFMGVWPLFNFYGLLKNKPWVKKSNRLLGSVTILWIAYEALTIRTFSPLQPIIFFAGLALLTTKYDGQILKSS